MRFLFYDRVTAIEKGKRIVGVKSLSSSEAFLEKHFTRVALIPGVLLIEAMAQLLGWLVCYSHDFRRVAIMTLLDGVRVPAALRPGVRLDIDGTLVTNTERDSLGVATVSLDGEVIAMTPQGSRHAAAVARINRVLLTALGDQVSLRPQLPLILDERSEPEPDIAVCRRDARDYASEHPGPADTLLVIEVADTSLDYDRRRKARAYATAGIPAFWIVNLPDRCLEWFADPDPASGRFLREERVAESGTVTLPGGATIPVTDLLPPV